MDSSAASRFLCVRQDGPLCRITLNRPERRNALSTELTEALLRTTAQVVVLDATGPAFCAGHDLDEMKGHDAGAYQQIFAVCTRLMRTIQSIPAPVIAQVHGIATAAGCHIIATGSKYKELGLENEKRLSGHGVSWCAVG